MRLHELTRRQYLPIGIEEAFEFFCDARNLESITPPWLNFRLIEPVPVTLEPGALIDYRLRLHGVPVRWRTQISTWEPPLRFVDRQLRGPYALWEHLHTFEPAEGGTLMGDHVRYALPWGPLGAAAHRLFVRRDLDRIFDYRVARIRALLGAPSAQRGSALGSV